MSCLDDGKRKTKRGWSPGDSLNLVRVLSVRVNYSQQCRNDINGRWEYSKSIMIYFNNFWLIFGYKLPKSIQGHRYLFQPCLIYDRHVSRLFHIETRQHSTQSVRNMPPPSPRHLLPHVLQIMPRNANYDQFQPKGHHNEENPQSMTKMPGNPKFYLFHWVKIASKKI